MAEKYRFFDAVEDEFGVYDREYNAQEFTDYFKALVTTGIMKGAGNELAVSTNGSSMITSVNTGIAFLLGRYYENDSPLELTHDTETLGNSRIDRIVIRMDLNTNARYVRAFIKKGVASANPVPPTLTQTANLYEISVAQVSIVGGQTFIAADAITDERGKDVICPWAGSNILPNFNDDVLEQLVSQVDTIVPSEWIDLPTTNGWIVGPEGLRIRKEGEFVRIYGRVNPPNPSSGSIFTLPVGYRSDNIYTAVFGSGAPLSINLLPNGTAFVSNVTGAVHFNLTFKQVG